MEQQTEPKSRKGVITAACLIAIAVFGVIAFRGMTQDASAAVAGAASSTQQETQLAAAGKSADADRAAITKKTEQIPYEDPGASLKEAAAEISAYDEEQEAALLEERLAQEEAARAAAQQQQQQQTQQQQAQSQPAEPTTPVVTGDPDDYCITDGLTY